MRHALSTLALCASFCLVTSSPASAQADFTLVGFTGTHFLEVVGRINVVSADAEGSANIIQPGICSITRRAFGGGIYL